MTKSLFLPLLAVAAFILLVGLMVQGKLGNFEPIYTPQNGKNSPKIVKLNETEISVEIARSDSERQKGLGGRKSLDENSGMLFVFSSNSKPSFWMKDTLIPLDIVWIKDDKVTGIEKNVAVQEGVADSDLTLYPAPGVVDYVLEVNAGFSEKNNIKPGSTFQMLFDL